MGTQSEALPEAQDALLRLVAWTIAGRGYAPSIRELAAQLQVAPNAVRGRLNALREKGLVDWEARKQRSLHLTFDGMLAARPRPPREGGAMDGETPEGAAT